MKAYVILISHLEIDNSMDHWGDYDWAPSRVTNQYGLYHSALNAYNDIEKYLEKYKRHDPVFVGIKEITLNPPKFNDEEITEEEQQNYKIQTDELVAKRLEYKNRILTFGKHKGKRICDVINEDYNYMKWAVTKGIISLNKYENYTYKSYGIEPDHLPEYNQPV